MQRQPTHYPRRSDEEWQHLRQQAAARFARGERIIRVAEALQVSPQAVGVWRQKWRAGGPQALRGPGRSGRPRRLSDRQCRQLQVLLLQGATAHGYGTDLWTLERISALIRQHFGVRYHPGHVFKLLHRLGWSCQKPARRAKQRDEAAIAHWRRHTWPQIKKGP